MPQTEWKLDSMTPASAKDHYQNCQGCSDKSGVNSDGVCWACHNQYRIGYRNPTTGMVDGKGIISSPGKFEGCPRYVPYFWERALEGFSDDDGRGNIRIAVIPEDKDIFPELKKRRSIKLRSDDQGFVYEI